jgi:hypothetical protein
MGRITNYRAKIEGLIDKEEQCLNELYAEDDFGEIGYTGPPEEEFNHKFTIKELEKVIRLLDALKSVGIDEGPGFCNKISEKTGYSRNRVSDMLSGNAPLNTRFIKANCITFGTSEDYIIDGKGLMATVVTPSTTFEQTEDVAIKEAILILKSMSDSDRWHAVATLKEMISK